jgi:putative ubiquitin-RnfH superfamily antitoxin RatB of RatAB toxin-antitoxin module
VKLQAGATVEQAIISSGILALREDIDLAKNKVGIYSRPVKLHDESAYATSTTILADTIHLFGARGERLHHIGGQLFKDVSSGILALREDIDLAKNKVGIYSRPVKLHDEVHDGDRVEMQVLFFRQRIRDFNHNISRHDTPLWRAW